MSFTFRTASQQSWGGVFALNLRVFRIDYTISGKSEMFKKLELTQTCAPLNNRTIFHPDIQPGDAHRTGVKTRLAPARSLCQAS